MCNNHYLLSLEVDSLCTVRILHGSICLINVSVSIFMNHHLMPFNNSYRVCKYLKRRKGISNSLFKRKRRKQFQGGTCLVKKQWAGYSLV